MLTKLGLAAARWVEKTPWTNVYGVARTALALGTLGTLLFTSPGALFAPALGVPPAPYCTSVGSISLFCVMPERYIEPAGPVRAVGAPRLLAFRTDRFAIDLEVTNRAW